MLILTRSQEQAITISHPDGDVVVRVVGIVYGRVQLGIVAPASVKVLRTELTPR